MDRNTSGLREMDEDCGRKFLESIFLPAKENKFKFTIEFVHKIQNIVNHFLLNFQIKYLAICVFVLIKLIMVLTTSFFSNS